MRVLMEKPVKNMRETVKVLLHFCTLPHDAQDTGGENGLCLHASKHIVVT
jgi:hypothetical protein